MTRLGNSGNLDRYTLEFTFQSCQENIPNGVLGLIGLIRTILGRVSSSEAIGLTDQV